MEEKDNSNLKDKIRTLIRFWLRNMVSNCCESIRDEEFEEMWNSKPIFAGQRFHDANDTLFKFVACSDSSHFSNFEDSQCIKMRENRHAFYSFVHSFAEKSMNDIKEAVDGLFTSQNIEEEKEEGKVGGSDSEEEIDTHRPLFNVNKNQLQGHSSSDEEEEIVNGWTWNTLLKSVTLKEIVASSNIYTEILNMCTKILKSKLNYTRKIVIIILKELREYYFKALSSTSPEEIDINNKIEVLSIFTNRSSTEIRSVLKHEQVKVIEKRIRTLNILEDKSMSSEDQADTIFNTWMASQHLIVNSRIPLTLQRLFELIKREQTIEEENILNELTIASIQFLDNPAMFEFLNDDFEYELLKTNLFLLGMNHESIENYTTNKKRYFEQNILKHLSNIIISNKNISLISIRDTLYSLLKKSKSLCTKLLYAELAKNVDYNVYNQKNIEVDLILKQCIEAWKDKFLIEISNHSLCGLCFRIISNTTGMKYFEVKPFEKDILVRIQAHERKFNDYGNEGRPWVKYKYKNNNLKNKRKNQVNPSVEQQIIGFYCCYFCYSSFRTTKGKTHENFKKRELKFDRQFIKKIEFDFSGIPTYLARISTALKDYIQFGILYTFTKLSGRLRTFTLCSDTRQSLHNGQLSFVKFTKRLVPPKDLNVDKIEEAVNWLKRNNHLSTIFPTIYESEAIKRELEAEDANYDADDENFITIYPGEMDREFQENQIIEKLGRKFVLTDDMPSTIKDQRKARSELYRSFKSVVFYNDEYLEEKLFVHLFPTGTGGYNSTFSKCMPLIQYSRMRLLSGYTDKFRSDNRYIFFLYDWLRKKRIYTCNNSVNFFKLNEVNKELLQETYEYKDNGDFDYYEKLGSKMFAQIKHSQEYKAERFYEIQALLQKFGKPELFVTVCFNHIDEEITSYVKEVFKAKDHGVINFNNYPVEFAIFYKKKVQFVRSLFKPENEIPSIFGRVKAYVDTLEYTKTGIPHLHFLLWLHDEDKQFASIENNNLVFARAKNPRGERDDELNYLINEYQTHFCLQWKCNFKKNGAYIDRCIAGYPHPPVDKDYAEYTNSTVYYARGPEDANVVPYNPEFLKLMKCSTNVQIVNSENIAVYMSKYITVTRKDYIRKGCKPDDRERQQINPVETYLKEKRITIIEAAMELIQSQSYCIYPKLYNLKIRLPNERFLKLLPFNQIRGILERQDDSQETNYFTENDIDEEEQDNEILENILAPSMWENYMARNSALENMTIIEMLSKFIWCGNQNSIPKRCIRPDEPGFYKQWSFSQLEEYRIKEDAKYINIVESEEMTNMRKNQKKICLDNKNQLALYCYTQKTPKIINTLRRNYKNKDELFWFEFLITHVPFRSFWELLIYDGKAYETFQEVCEVRGLLRFLMVEDSDFKTNNSLENLDRKLNGFVDGRMFMGISEFKRTIANICKSIEISEDNYLLNEKFRNCGFEYARKFGNLYREIKKKEMLIEKKDLLQSFKQELSSEVKVKSKYYMEFCYNIERHIEMDYEKDMCVKAFKSFKKFEPEVTPKLNEELDKFYSHFNNPFYFSRSQKKVITYLLKNMFNKNKNCFYITGNAGTGKSFLLRELVRLFESVLNLNVLVCASTGTAAKNINGTTVHKAFNINPSNVASICMPGSYTFMSLKKKDVIIIDEISMISEDILQNIDLTLRNTQIDKAHVSDNCLLPFGGKMVILFGDLLQIPCVNEQKIGEYIRQVRPIHKSDSFGNFEWIFLYDQMRAAKDFNYSDVCTELSTGLKTDTTREWLKRRVCPDGQGSLNDKDKMLESFMHDTTINNVNDCDICSNSNILIVASNNYIKNKHNYAKLNALFNPQDIIIYKAQYYVKGQKTSGFSLRDYSKYFFSDNHAFEEEIMLAVGCKVICNINISIKDGLTNGTIGKIVAMHDEILEFEYFYKDVRRIAYITRIFEDCTIPTLEVSRGQFPINLAYCLTMHKCQGQTLDGVVIDCSEIFAPGLFYSTLARCKNANNIHIKRLIPSKHIIFDEEVVNLIKEKELYYASTFEDKFNELPDINNCMKQYMLILREGRVSLSVIKDYIEKRLSKALGMHCVLNTEELKECNIWIERLHSYLREREEIMFNKYEENKANVDIDWRDNSSIEVEAEITDLFKRFYHANDNDIEENLEQYEVIENVEEIKDDVWTERIHDYESDYCIPWTHWLPEMKGFDCFFLLFNKCVYSKMTDEEKDYFFEKDHKNVIYVRELYNSLLNLLQINEMTEYSSHLNCQRIKTVITPFLMRIRDSEYIEDILKRFKPVNDLVGIRANCYYDCRNKCKGSDYSSMHLLLKEKSYLVIESNVFEVAKKKTMHINDRIIFNCLYEYIDQKCEKCHYNLFTSFVDLLNFPKFIFVINRQESHSREGYYEFDANKRIRIYKESFGDLSMNFVQDNEFVDYCLKGTILLNYEGNYSTQLQFEVDGIDYWFQFHNKKNGSKLIEPMHEPDPTISFKTTLENSLMWPVIFLYVKDE